MFVNLKKELILLKLLRKSGHNWNLISCGCGAKPDSEQTDKDQTWTVVDWTIINHAGVLDRQKLNLKVVADDGQGLQVPANKNHKQGLA